jgi:hypothetical protein
MFCPPLTHSHLKKRHDMCTTLASTPSLHLSPGPRRPRIHRLTPSLLLAGLWGLVLTAALLSSLPGGVVGDAREPSATPDTKEPRLGVLANTGADTPCPLPPAPRTGDASTGPEHDKVRVPAHSLSQPHVLLWGALAVREPVRARARAVS